jgi:hypothetical protein
VTSSEGLWAVVLSTVTLLQNANQRPRVCARGLSPMGAYMHHPALICCKLAAPSGREYAARSGARTRYRRRGRMRRAACLFHLVSAGYLTPADASKETISRWAGHAHQNHHIVLLTRVQSCCPAAGALRLAREAHGRRARHARPRTLHSSDFAPWLPDQSD